jgi:hypothetical protein
MLPWELKELTEQRLIEVVANGREESQTLEYKRSMPFATWEEKLKVLKAVSAFANTFGGDLVIGIAAVDGIPKLPIDGILAADIDCLKLAFESVARDSLDPPFPAGTVCFQSIPIGNDGRAVLVARVAQSWRAPHRIGRKGDREFWTRTNAGKEPMTMSQLRDAFVLSGTVREKIREFVCGRINELSGNAGHRPNTPIDLPRDSPQFVLHALPIAAFARHDIRIGVVPYRENNSKLAPISSRRHVAMLNLDGVAPFCDPRSPAPAGYTQLYREGMLEALQCVAAQVRPGSPLSPEREIHVGYFERDLRGALSRYLSLLSDESLGAPICLYLTLLHASNCRLTYTQEHFFCSSRPVGSYIASLPEVLIHDVSQPEVDKQLKVLFDSLWNCGDVPASPSFDDSGVWCGPCS